MSVYKSSIAIPCGDKNVTGFRDKKTHRSVGSGMWLLQEKISG
jgi:hypothetical protein